MDSGEMKKYEAVSRFYKELVTAITEKELGQLKLYMVNLQKRIELGKESVLAQYSRVKDILDTLKEAKGKVALHFACARGDCDVVRFLVEGLGADHKVRDKEGNTPFFTSIEHGSLPLVEYFVADLDCSARETKEGEISALHLACNHGNLDIIDFLIGRGADLEKVSVYGKPLNWAVGSGQQEAARLLLERGADPRGDTSGSNIAPIIIAIDTAQQQVYQMLLDKGVDIGTRDPNGYSLLHLAAEKGNLPLVQQLVEKGADLRYEAEGKSPLYLAFEHSQWQVVSFLKGREPEHERVEQRWREEAERIARQKVEPDKERAEEIKNIGNKFYAGKQYEEALAQYLKALSYDPQNEVLHRNIAACCLALQQFERALAHCQQARKTGDKNIKTIYREAQAYQGLGNLVDASSSMWECCMLQPSNQMFRLEFQKLIERAKAEHQKNT